MLNLNTLIPVRNQHSHVLRVDDSTAWFDIKKPRYNLAIMSRKASGLLESAVQELMHSSFSGIDMVLEQPKNWPEAIVLLVGCKTTSNWIKLEPLVNDISMCCELFVTITGAQTVRLSLKVITTDACRKFHIDGYTYRLLCSYYGPGTEWVYNENVNRKYLGLGENNQIIKDWSAIQRINTFDIAILKGELPHQRNGKGIVHRSPPIQHTNDKRLVLRIDYTS
ncbi:MAG: DUF1826 domain-containing protein [Cyclobacteriaceae bacterium]